MKREYNRPTVEKIEFDYRNQVVAASGGAAALSDDGGASNPYGIPDELWDIAKDLGLDKLIELISQYV